MSIAQTDDYAREVLARHPHVTPDQVTERVAARMARQLVVDRDDPAVFWVLVDESILHREIGSPKIMADQLDKLAEMARLPDSQYRAVVSEVFLLDH